ncbi:hypothetical protein M0812_28807 [Anaeramoeba flamelloides]|uniref:Uncharacterized protein n=1 Tax=Anaeramoeba flamelloides TaxID=1746091 RepID=A0AAV7Y987_9EUKA|nr:hypothetical protein M0812_28807 [Anaeramoeba flamelloides]
MPPKKLTCPHKHRCLYCNKTECLPCAKFLFFKIQNKKTQTVNLEKSKGDESDSRNESESEEEQEEEEEEEEDTGMESGSESGSETDKSKRNKKKKLKRIKFLHYLFVCEGCKKKQTSKQKFVPFVKEIQKKNEKGILIQKTKKSLFGISLVFRERKKHSEYKKMKQYINDVNSYRKRLKDEKKEKKNNKKKEKKKKKEKAQDKKNKSKIKGTIPLNRTTSTQPKINVQLTTSRENFLNKINSKGIRKRGNILPFHLRKQSSQNKITENPQKRKRTNPNLPHTKSLESKERKKINKDSIQKKKKLFSTSSVSKVQRIKQPQNLNKKAIKKKVPMKKPNSQQKSNKTTKQSNSFNLRYEALQALYLSKPKPILKSSVLKKRKVTEKISLNDYHNKKDNKNSPDPNLQKKNHKIQNQQQLQQQQQSKQTKQSRQTKIPGNPPNNFVPANIKSNNTSFSINEVIDEIQKKKKSINALKNQLFLKIQNLENNSDRDSLSNLIKPDFLCNLLTMVPKENTHQIVSIQQEISLLIEQTADQITQTMSEFHQNRFNIEKEFIDEILH